MEHLVASKCPCNPTVIPVKRDNGSIGYVYAHHEPELTPADNAERAARIYEAMEIVRLQTDG